MLRLIPLAFLLLAAPAQAQEEKIALKDVQGRDVVEQNCSACHSLDYIVMNSPFLDQAKWEATVKKMIASYHAPIEPADSATILAYLQANYGAEPPP
jgi:sulfite dehydrogenase (cytochrome) subunit B